ncbi:peamaclein-like [Dioscorea cayenensis subsp. rotundata]|uniref:Peamaclein-like n=1 Tax=Dioscorea cayennensis subsp. rotundata TaxID=55577 RepID=A0AB40CNQ8_DIOCR|nr:peamaclein-like [Dioscorea cayenensis subsp. rotundata]
MKLSSATLVLILLLITTFLQAAMAGSGFCSGKCKVRCSKASIKDRCLKYCNICCKECKCVPSGTYGNKDQCPCYRDKVVKGSKKPKCP